MHLRRDPSVKKKEKRKMAAPLLPPDLTPEQVLWLTLSGNAQGNDFWGNVAKSPH